MTKQDIRKLANAERHKLKSEDKKAFSHLICEKLINMSELKDASVIFSYRNMEDEVCLDEFHDWAKANGKTLAFPVCRDGGIMDAFVPGAEDAWEYDRYGIASPVEKESVPVEPKDIDVIIVPCVAFDEHLGRCGHGAGYYDRYIAKCPDAHLICVAFEAQKVEKVVTDSNDFSMKKTVTCKRIYE